MNPEPGGLTLRFEVDGDDFTSAGQASVQVKKSLRQLGISPDIIRKVSIAMYEGEINMVIHAGGGVADVLICEDHIAIRLEDRVPALRTLILPCRRATPRHPTRSGASASVRAWDCRT